VDRLNQSLDVSITESIGLETTRLGDLSPRFSTVEGCGVSRNIFMLRKALGESPQDHLYILTVPGRGYRLAESVRPVPEQELSIVAAQHSKVQIQVKESKPWAWVAVGMIVAASVAFGIVRTLMHRPPLLSGKDTVVLADFANSTGEPYSMERCVRDFRYSSSSHRF
jgi:hypothetical protein